MRLLSKKRQFFQHYCIEKEVIRKGLELILVSRAQHSVEIK